MARQVEAPVKLLDIEGRSVRHEQYPCAGACEMGRRGRVPDVLADGKPEGHVPEHHGFRQWSGREDALLVEDAVIGQVVLEAQVRAAVRDEGGGVVDVAVGRPRQRDDEAGKTGDALAFQFPEDGGRSFDERRPEDKVLRRVTDEHQFREDNEVGAERGGVVARAADQRGIARQIPYRWVGLRECDGERHGTGHCRTHA